MEINTFVTGKGKIAEISSRDIIIHDLQSSVDLIGNIYYQGYDALILHEENIAATFFDLKTKLAGEILQKFSNYRMQLAITGNWNDVPSKSLRDFIRESNTGKQIFFVDSTEDAVFKLST